MANSAGSASIDIAVPGGFVKDLKSDLERIDADFQVDVSADLTRFREQIARLDGADVTVNVDLAGVEAVAARLAELARDRTTTINVDLDDKGGLERAKAGADNAERSLSGMGAVKFVGLTSAITALVPALLGVVGAAGGAAAALGAIGGVGLIGSTGLVDTFKAIKEQSNSAGDAADGWPTSSTTWPRPPTTSPTPNRTWPTHSATHARPSRIWPNRMRDARRALRDMNDELTDSALAQEDAEISLARAQERRNEVYRDGGSSTLDRREADLGVDKARQRLKEARSDHADKATDTGEANRKGIEGSDEVQNAKQAKAAADQKVADAQSKLADAAYNLAKAQKELARAPVPPTRSPRQWRNSRPTPRTSCDRCSRWARHGKTCVWRCRTSCSKAWAPRSRRSPTRTCPASRPG